MAAASRSSQNYGNMNRQESIKAYEQAIKYIPGGVNSPVRALKSVGESPLFIKKAEGVTLTDIDNNTFTDYCLSWGVFIQGHTHPKVQDAVYKSIANGTSYGIPSIQETVLARLVNKHVPSMEKVRFVNSGTEAVMSAIRLARGFTKRNIIIKFDGCYHGHADHLLVSAGSGVASLGGSSSAGIPDSFTRYTISLPFNDTESLRKLFSEKGYDIAAIIVEPVPANMGVVIPKDNFLKFLREITLQYRSLLIFDVVITGFRLSIGGAQKRFGITPDLTTLGKIVGGGFPAAAFGGREEIMNMLAPCGPVYQAGTLSGNPIAMTAGINAIEILEDSGFYQDLEEKSEAFLSALQAETLSKDIQINFIGSMFTLFFTDGKVQSFTDVKKCDTERFARFFRYMLAANIYISPSQFESNFISSAHSDLHLERFIDLTRKFSG